MKFIKKFLSVLFGFDKTIEALQQYAANQRKEIDHLSVASFVSIEPIKKDEIKQFNEYLASISKSRFFNFYLMTMENELMQILRDCPVDKASSMVLQVRGAMQLINSIRSDLRRAERRPEEAKPEDQNIDFILHKIEAMQQAVQE